MEVPAANSVNANKVSHMKQYLEERYAKLKQQTINRENRRKDFEISLEQSSSPGNSSQKGLSNTEKESRRTSFNQDELDQIREHKKVWRKDDFEPLELIGKGAFGEVVLVRLKDSVKVGSTDTRIYGILYLMKLKCSKMF